MPSLYYNVVICGHSSIPGAAAPSKIFYAVGAVRRDAGQDLSESFGF